MVLSPSKYSSVCFYFQFELNYHWSTLSLKYHLLAKHTANAESLPPLPEADHAG